MERSVQKPQIRPDNEECQGLKPSKIKGLRPLKNGFDNNLTTNLTLMTGHDKGL